MKQRNNLQARILLFILSTVILVFIIIGLFVGIRNKQFSVVKAQEYAQLMAKKNANEVHAIFERFNGYLEASSDFFTTTLKSNTELNENEIDDYLYMLTQKDAHIEASWLLIKTQPNTNNQGTYILYKNLRDNNATVSINNTIETAKYTSLYIGNGGLNITEPYLNNDILVADLYAPIKSGNRVIGKFGITLQMSIFEDFVKNSYIYEGGFITVMSNSSLFVGHSVSAFIGKHFGENFAQENATHHIEKKVADGSEFEITTHFKRQTYYSYFVPIAVVRKDKPWMVEVTVPMHKMLEASVRSIWHSVLFALGGIIIMIFVIWLSTRYIISPIKKVTNILDYLSYGDTKSVKSLSVQTGDELQKMSDSLNKVVDGLRKTESFALEIGNGNLEHDYELLGSRDQLGKALIAMRDSLKKSRDAEEKRKKEESLRNWATEGIAKFAEILRQDNDDIKKLSFNVMSNLINYLDVNQGAMFVLNNDDENHVYYELTTAIAYGRQKYMNNQVEIGQGLVGRCAYEQKTIFLKEVPEDYVNITSGLGTANPRCVLIAPCILNDEVFGIIEIAAFKTLEKYEIEFVEKLGESIGATISSVKINEKTTRLLRASQQQSEELAAQEEEMRQNLEEMQATQEDLQRQNQLNEEMKASLTQQSALLNSLLGTIPDYIYFKDEQSKFLKISESMKHLFHANSVADIIGKTDFDFKSHEEAQKYFNDEQNIIKTKKGIKNQLQREVGLDGTVQWNSVTKMPLMDDNGNCIGTFGISKDVTALKELELESSKKQAELESILNSVGNSTFMIQYNLNGEIIDVNQAVVDLFGIDKNQFLGTHHRDGFDFRGKTEDQYQKFWNRIVSGEIVKEENRIEVNNKIVWLSETYNPIYNEKGEIYKIIKLAFDITNYKNT